MGLDAMILALLCWVSSQHFHSHHSPSSRGSLFPLHFLPLEWYHLHIWGCWYFSQQFWFQVVIHPAQHFTWYILHAAAAAAKLLQSCLTLWDPIDGSLPDSPVPGILQARTIPSPMHESEVTQSCPTLCDPMDCSLPGSAVHGSFQARVLEWVAISFSVVKTR